VKWGGMIRGGKDEGDGDHEGFLFVSFIEISGFGIWYWVFGKIGSCDAG
jgi:hypothetical protein